MAAGPGARGVPVPVGLPLRMPLPGCLPFLPVRVPLPVTRARPLVAVGLLLAGAAMRLLATLLFGVQPRDPLTFAAVALLVLADGTVARVLPARAVAAVVPSQALRAE